MPLKSVVRTVPFGVDREGCTSKILQEVHRRVIKHVKKPWPRMLIYENLFPKVPKLFTESTRKPGVSSKRGAGDASTAMQVGWNLKG